jgi:hypothetical protein
MFGLAAVSVGVANLTVGNTVIGACCIGAGVLDLLACRPWK